MKILHIINDSPSKLAKQIIDLQLADNEVKVIELSRKTVPYNAIIDDIFSSDKVISW